MEVLTSWEHNLKIDLEHLHYWMQAIRASKNHQRTLDAFWRGQVNSKVWLIEKLRPYVFRDFGTSKISVDINGGWVGVLASLMFQSELPIDKIRSIDIDSSCEELANVLNTPEEITGRFRAVTADMCDVKTQADVVINTVCEHLTQDQYELWLKNIPDRSLIVLQSNDYKMPEHIRIAKNIEHFKEQSNLNIIYSGELDQGVYKRFMLIGKK